MFDEIPVWHQNFFLNMPDYSNTDITNISKIKNGLSRFVSISKIRTLIDDPRHNGAVSQLHTYDYAVKGIHEIDSIGSILDLMFPIMGFEKEKHLLRIRLLHARGADTENINNNPKHQEIHELDKGMLSIRALKLYIECNVSFTDYLCVATLKIWKKYIEQNKNYHSDFDKAVEAALFGAKNIKQTTKAVRHSELQIQVLLAIRKEVKGKKSEIFLKCQEREPHLFGNIKRNRFDQIWVDANKREKLNQRVIENYHPLSY